MHACSRTDYRLRNVADSDAGPIPHFPPPSQEEAEAVHYASVQATPKGDGNIKNNNNKRRHGDRTLPPNFSVPFLTEDAGALPHGPPSCVDELNAHYLVNGATRMPPNLDIDFESVECSTNGEARRALAKAEAECKLFWGAIHVPGIEHPTWWPVRAEPVPGFEHMIVGVRDAGIGMHRDRYTKPLLPHEACDGGAPPPERLVSTYLTLGLGRKHIILLPPTDKGAHVAQTLGGAGCDDAYGRRDSQRARFPVRPPPDVLERVLDAGGFWFDVEVVASSDSETSSNGDGDEDDSDEGGGGGGGRGGEEEEEAALEVERTRVGVAMVAIISAPRGRRRMRRSSATMARVRRGSARGAADGHWSRTTTTITVCTTALFACSCPPAGGTGWWGTHRSTLHGVGRSSPMWHGNS